MQEYWNKVRKDALDSMRRLVGQDVEDNCEDMERALEYAFKHGTTKEAAKATSDYFDYKWAMHEITAHKQTGTMAK